MQTLFPFSPDVVVFTHLVGGEPVKAVRAKDLHAFLGIPQPLVIWMQHTFRELEFRCDVDYVLAGDDEESYTNACLTTNTARQMAMTAETPMGRAVRQYYSHIAEIADPGGFPRFLEEMDQQSRMPKSDMPSPQWEEIMPPSA